MKHNFFKSLRSEINITGKNEYWNQGEFDSQFLKTMPMKWPGFSE
jgi:hypothetical protein